ncbi:MAG: ABC transporter substrate-binding protein [candidate division NC10 bacterium]|nr:ABC transporter substrate-binding protein [candidate division NC10 bacterium]MBI2115498.1 ABC transporter substrate-binding protein [candidate division NC10 bacterium]MBI3086123.1 ABC transporter substrate-binding protein [candidate division NC10 bacterium]
MRLQTLGPIIAIGLGLLSAPLASQAQQAKRPYRIGVLHTAFFQNIPVVEGLKAGLKADGLEEGRDLTFDIRFTRGDVQAAPAAAAALAKDGVDLIVAEAEEATRAAKAATRTIPIVFTQVGDPVAARIVMEIAHPGGNVTGVSSLATELAPKRLEILKTIFPSVRRVWALYYATEDSSLAAARKAREVAPLLKLEVMVRPVRTPEELVAHLKGLRPGDGLLAPPTVTMNIPGVILDLELGAKWPAVFNTAFWVQSGAVVSYGSNAHADGVQAARLVAKILRGARPQDLPVEGANKIELAINLKTAKSLGVTIPREILARADQVIQ